MSGKAGGVEKGKNAITFRLPKDLMGKLDAYLESVGDRRLSHVGYYLLGFLFAHDVFRANPELALEVVAKIKFGRGSGNAKVDRLLKSLIRKTSSGKKKVENHREVEP